MTWDELNADLAGGDMDMEIDYETFDQLAKADPSLQALVKRYAEGGIELKTKRAGDTAPSDATADRNTVGQAAKRATAKARG